MAKLGAWQNTIQDALGRAIPGAQLTVRDIAGGLLSLFSDRDGTMAIGNPFLADSDGFARFYCAPGRVNITATAGGRTRTLNNVIVMEEYVPEVVITEAGTDRTLSLTDAGATIVCTNGFPVELLVPADLAFDPLATIYAHQAGAGQVSFIADEGVLLRHPATTQPATVGQRGTIAIRMIGENEWIVVGQLAEVEA